MERREFAGSCIICIGFRGTGKSTTIQTCTLQEEHTSGGAIWEGTVGWDDTEGRNDQQSFQEVLRFINSNGCTKIYAIIWTINPDVKETQTLQKQADFINQFKHRDIWRNVLIIAKSNDDAAVSCQGALAAGKKFSGGNEVMTLSYNYMENVSKEQQNKLKNDPELRKTFNVYTSEEVYKRIKSKLDSIEKPVQVIFEDKKCLACGVQGDERLLPEKCHEQKQMIHKGVLQKVHPGVKTSVHVLSLEKKHPGNVALKSRQNSRTQALRRKGAAAFLNILIRDGKVDLAAVLAGILDVTDAIVPKYTCCGKEQTSECCKAEWKCCGKGGDNPGCKKQYSCCKQEVVVGVNNGCERIHDCCKQLEGSQGCIAICRYCRNPWGDPTTACVSKKHELVNIPQQG